MAETTASASMSTKTEEGVHIKGRDAVFLDTPKILFPENAPLHNTDLRELYAILDELFQLEPGGGDDWQPPDMPEPSAYEIYLLVEVADVSDSYMSKLEIRVSRPEDAVSGYGSMSVDWGDGTIQEWNEGRPITGYPDYYGWGNLTHNYAEVGRYLVKISATEHSCYLQRLAPTGGMRYCKILCAKLGSEIVVNRAVNDSNNGFRSQARLQYIKLSGRGGLPPGCFYGCPALKRIDIAYAPSIIYDNTFRGCANLKKFDFSAAENIQSEAFNGCYNLEKVNAPLCASVGNNTFSNCYGLQEITVAEDCSFGSNCFSNCFSLYPRPDGSVN